MEKLTGTGNTDINKVTTVAAIAYDIQKKIIRKLVITVIILLILCGISVITALYALSTKRCNHQSHVVGVTAVTSAYLGRYIRQNYNKYQLVKVG